jgi:hypothetical protein
LVYDGDMTELSGSTTDPRTVFVDTSVTQVEKFNLKEGNEGSLLNVFGRDSRANNGRYGYLYSYFKDTVTDLNQATATNAGIAQSGSRWQLGIEVDESDNELRFEDGADAGSSQFDVRPAVTPWIKSQQFEGDQRYNLFRFHTLSDGTTANREFKVSISEVRAPTDDVPYGTFTVTLRRIGDTDQRQQLVESYNGVSLDPNSPTYIARVIGDTKITINSSGKIFEDGDYPNNSRNIRVEMADAGAPAEAVPYGFGIYLSPIADGDVDFTDYIDPLVYSNMSTAGTGLFSGLVFTDGTLDGELYYPKFDPTVALDSQDRDQLPQARNTLEFLAPVPENAATPSGSIVFALDDFEAMSPDGTVDATIPAIAGSTPNPATGEIETEGDKVRKRRFTLGFQRGFEGQSPARKIALGDEITPTNTQGLDCSTLNSDGSKAYVAAINALSNADEFDINLIATPGLTIEQHRSVTRRVIDMCEFRGDCFYIVDNAKNLAPGSAQSAVNIVTSTDTNYAATYYPWVKIVDDVTNKFIDVPPSVLMPAVYAQNDRVAAEWFAPAGLNRGGISQAVKAVDRLTFSERDLLYENNVNPIASFPGEGVVAFGQKTLQREPTALDRVNVRRLLINLKKFIASSSRFLLFEQNTAATRNQFLSIVNPFLESVQQQQGLYGFRVVMDENLNTPEVIDRNQLKGEIYLQPTRAVEFILLDFILLPTGASFSG